MDALINTIAESLKVEWGNLLSLFPRILAAVIVFGFVAILGQFLGRVVTHLLSKGRFKASHKHFFKQLIVWLCRLAGVILAFNILGLEKLATGLLAGGGITAVVLGFAFREIGENFLAGFFLAFSRPFEEGDLIESEGLQGVVKSIELRSTHIRSADGRDIFIPSSQIFKNALANYTRDGLRRVSFTVGIDYANDSQTARKQLAESVHSVPGVEPEPAPGSNINSLAPTYVELEVYFWVDTFRKGVNLADVRNDVIEQCKRTLLDGGYTLSSNVQTALTLETPQPMQILMTSKDSG